MVRPLGQGAMGEVHIAKDLLLKRKVAIKWIKEDNTDNQARMRFVREVLITAQLDHPTYPSLLYGKTQSGDIFMP